MLNKSLIALAALAAILLLFTFPEVNVIRGSGGGPLYWNANEALLFIQVSRSGARMSLARYALEPFLVGLGHVRQPSDERCSQVLVIRITDRDVQRYETEIWRYAEEPYCGFQAAPFEGRIYVGYLAQDKVWKWSGTQLEPSTAEELRAFHAAKAGTKPFEQHPWEFDNVEGWSMREFGMTPPKYEIVLSGRPVRITFHGPTWPPQPVSVELIRPGQAAQTIWSFDEEPRRVSKLEYERVFAPR